MPREYRKGLPRKRHGLARHPLYKLLIQMKRRCYEKTRKNYQNYGGRGITVCEEWVKYPATFVSWALENGWKPGLQIDRIDNDGNYEPDNCRFVTCAENIRNSKSAKLNRRIVSYIRMRLLIGERQQDIADRYGVSRQCISRINNKQTWKDVL